MRNPKICPPVRQLPEEIVRPALRREFPIDADTGRPAVNPATGKPDYFWDFERGSNPFPNAPQRFPLLVSCESECYVFSGFSRALCLLGCGR